MVHMVTIRSAAAYTAASSTGQAALVIELCRVSVEHLECSEDIVRGPCHGLSSSSAHECVCVFTLYCDLTLVQRARHSRACRDRERADTR